MQYNISYVYHAMSSFFNRDTVALPGLAKYFDEASKEEREHASELMNIQVGPIAAPAMHRESL